ncbi:response regulator transcription factor [Exiguobacterium sp. SH3S2]|uniref:response regulator transcription factor n=1 Tax=unclassified Exiguobacterium TaxID=2644629 RepID=UPI00103AEFF4|nr:MULTISPECIES: response regulator transcription factor [unclassified Exiguobacterium]TCI25525.1 response regulator transcription factor [Exiguobacterium sp. SH5S4]TCI42096.1 response regulator transcription factor [Exiguobacterium sp. SH3S3]TCI50273.1 response regulator transcription factor [Exiguobacterium sp. SH5S13]TCI58340.1 response regulator transcription factor [Exiguobacterium sp. SH3S2]TCI62634.1 response regulator transcription factor [Exiguobacterium sp. SH3S1]
MHVLIVEDDPAILRLIEGTLRQAGHHVSVAMDGHAAEQLFLSNPADAAVIDIMLPGMDGRQLCHRLKELVDIPVILLTALGEWEDKRSGFEHGADDYMTKPFIPEELLFRLQAVAKRYEKVAASLIKAGPLTLNLREHRLTFNQETIHLPKREFELLYQLAAFPGRVFSRDELIENVWGLEFDGDDRTIDVHIKRLRSRLPDETVMIRTVRGIGYTLEVKP